MSLIYNKSANDLGPAVDGVAVTPSDTVDISSTLGPTTRIYVGTAGNLVVTMVSGAVLTFTGLPAGMHNLAITRVWATGTTALGIVALY
jgi:hypothetical protein